MSFAVGFSARARRESREAMRWWQLNRPSAPDLFEDEIEAFITLVSGNPEIGMAAGPVVRKWVLPGTRYSVYYRYRPRKKVVEILSVWHGARGQGPKL